MAMAKVHHIKKALKDHPKYGIKKGDEYWWWKPRLGPKQCSKVPVDRRQLVISEFIHHLWDVEEEGWGGAQQTVSELMDRIKVRHQWALGLGKECHTKYNRMPAELIGRTAPSLALRDRYTQLFRYCERLKAVYIRLKMLDGKSIIGQEILDELSNIEIGL